MGFIITLLIILMLISPTYATFKLTDCMFDAFNAYEHPLIALMVIGIRFASLAFPIIGGCLLVHMTTEDNQIYVIYALLWALCIFMAWLQHDDKEK